MKHNKLLKGFYLYILTIILSSACKPDENGISIPNQRGVSADFIDTVAIELSSLLIDSLENSGINYMLLGRINDVNVSGTMQAACFLEFVPQNTPVGFPSNAILDSTTVTLEYDIVYGERKPVHFSIHQLNDSLRRDVPYFSTSTVGYQPTPWKTFTFTPTTLSDAKTYDTVRFRLDTLGKVIFAQNGQNSMATLNAFRNFVKGLALIPNASTDNTVLRFDTEASSYSRIRIFYHTPDDTNAKFVSLSLNAVNFSQISSSRSGTFFSALQTSGDRVVPTALNNYGTLLQGATGVRIKVDFPLQQLQALKDKIVLQRADLLLYPQDIGTYTPPNFLVVAEATSSNKLPTTEDKDVIFSLFNGDNPSQSLFRYDKTNKVYQMNITAYMHRLIYDNRNSNGLIVSVANTAVSPERVLVNGFKATDKPARLRLYYKAK